MTARDLIPVVLAKVGGHVTLEEIHRQLAKRGCEVSEGELLDVLADLEGGAF